MFCKFCEAKIRGGEINCIIFVEFYREKMAEYEKIFRLFKVIIIHFSKFGVNANSLMRLSFVLERYLFSFLRNNNRFISFLGDVA